MTLAFGKWLRDARSAARMTQLELAERVGVNHTYISKLEHAATDMPPSEELIRKLGAALAVDWTDGLKVSGRTVKLPADEFARLVVAKLAYEDALRKALAYVQWANGTRSELPEGVSTSYDLEGELGKVLGLKHGEAI